MDGFARRTKLLLIWTTAIFGLLLLPSAVLAPFIGFLYDEPAGGGASRTIFAVSWAGFWFVCLASIFGSWTLYKVAKFRAARLVALLPVLDIAVAVASGAVLFD